jgi:hypothetical protein
MSMLVQCRVVGFYEKLEAFATAKRVLEGCGFRGSGCPERCGAHGWLTAVAVAVAAAVELRGFSVSNYRILCIQL